MIVKPRLPIINRSHPLAKGLVADYPFFERGGTTLRDISGNNNHGTLTSMDPATDWILTSQGYGLDFDTTDYVTIPDSDILDFGTSPFFVETWIKTTVNNVRQVAVAKVDVTGNFIFEMGTDRTIANEIYCEFYVSGLFRQVLVVDSSFFDGKVHHLVAGHDGTAARLFIDGVLRGSSVGAYGNIDTASWAIGTYGAYSPPFRGWNGQIAKTRVWKKAPIAREIATLYADPWALYRSRRGIIGKAVAAAGVTYPQLERSFQRGAFRGIKMGVAA